MYGKDDMVEQCEKGGKIAETTGQPYAKNKTYTLR